MKLAYIVCCYESDNKKYQKSHILVYLKNTQYKFKLQISFLSVVTIFVDILIYRLYGTSAVRGKGNQTMSPLQYKSLTGERNLDEYVDSVPVFLAQVVDHAGELVFQDVIWWRLMLSAAAARHQQRRHPQPQQPVTGGHDQTGRMSTAQGPSPKPRAALSKTPEADERTARSDWNRRGHRENDAHWCDSSQNTITNGYDVLSPPPSFRLFMLCCSLHSAWLGGRLYHSPKVAAGQAWLTGATVMDCSIMVYFATEVRFTRPSLGLCLSSHANHTIERFSDTDKWQQIIFCIQNKSYSLNILHSSIGIKYLRKETNSN